MSDEPILCEHGNSAFACCAPGTPSSLRAELAEAKATIAQLTVENAKYRRDFVLIGATVGQQREIVEAARALREYRRGLNHWNGTIENDLINKLIDAVTAVEEGSKT